jgi:hypothetical protein
VQPSAKALAAAELELEGGGFAEKVAWRGNVALQVRAAMTSHQARCRQKPRY